MLRSRVLGLAAAVAVAAGVFSLRSHVVDSPGDHESYRDPVYGFSFRYPGEAVVDDLPYGFGSGFAPEADGTLGGVALYSATEEVFVIVRRRTPETASTFEQYKEFLLGDRETETSRTRLGGLAAEQHRAPGIVWYGSLVYTYAFTEDRIYFVDCVRRSLKPGLTIGRLCRQVLDTFRFD